MQVLYRFTAGLRSCFPIYHLHFTSNRFLDILQIILEASLKKNPITQTKIPKESVPKINISNATDGIRTREHLRDRALNPAPLTWLGNPRSKWIFEPAGLRPIPMDLP